MGGMGGAVAPLSIAVGGDVSVLPLSPPWLVAAWLLCLVFAWLLLLVFALFNGSGSHGRCHHA